MKQYQLSELAPESRSALCRRNPIDTAQHTAAVQEIIAEVRQRGDEALLAMAHRFDGVVLDHLMLGADSIANLASELPLEDRQAIDVAIHNIRQFHAAQRPQRVRLETQPGVLCWQEPRPIRRVGLYIPGGTAPLVSTLLMLAVPAQVAGCEEIVVVTPPQSPQVVHPAVAYALQTLGIKQLYLSGGAQAIAALAYGTASVPKVDKVFGPGNTWVTTAKSLLAGVGAIAIDMPAGPSEVLVIADHTANPKHVAADLLAQAEHGADSQVVLCCSTDAVAQAVLKATQDFLQTLPRAHYARPALAQSFVVVDADIQALINFSNEYAPEHLILNFAEAEQHLDAVRVAGSVFVGPHTPESVGDYASGTNHTLPTSQFARMYSGVNLLSFLTLVTFQQLSPEGLAQLGPTVIRLAQLETLDAHALAVQVRLAGESTADL